MDELPEVFHYLARMLECEPHEIVTIHIGDNPFVEIVKGYERVSIDDDIVTQVEEWLEEYSE